MNPVSPILRLANWVKANKLTFLLLAVIAYLLFGQTFTSLLSISGNRVTSYNEYNKLGYGGAGDVIARWPVPAPEAPPATDIGQRLVVQESQLSLLVKDVVGSQDAVKGYTEQIGGYMVSSSLSRPQGATSGNIVVRVPSIRLDEALNYFRSQSLRVVSENLTGQDVTDEFEDNEEKLRILERNKLRFEEIMESASEVEDILKVQEKIFQLQNQIDNIKGRQKYLEQTAALSRVSIYLSTDELSLPYSPAQPWRPEAIFKRAVRSLIANLQNLGSAAIWLGVYSVVWLPLSALIWYLRRRRQPV